MPVAHRSKERKDGSAIAEFGPALFVLLFCALFPALDFIGIGLSYCACVSLVDLQLREAVRIPKSQATDKRGSICVGIPNQWRPTVMGGLGRTVDVPVTQVSYAPSRTAIYVDVTTAFEIHPLLTIPLFPRVPGLGAPFKVTISRSRMLENPAFVLQ